MKGDAQVVLMIVFFFCGTLLGNAVSAETLLPFINSALTPLITLAAAYFGAKYAFELQDSKSKRESDSKDVSAANRAIFELIRAHNKFMAIDKQFIQEHRDNVDRYILILPTSSISWTPTKIDYDSLSFLFGSSDPNLLGKLSLVEQEIASTVDVIDQRSKLHMDSLQPAVERLQARGASHISRETIEAELGPRLSQTLRLSTDYMIDGVAAILAHTATQIEAIRKEVVRLYPGHRVIGMSIPAPVSGEPPANAPIL